MEKLQERANLYCELSKPRYDELRGGCDGALFTSLHGLLCDYVDLKQFEKEGRLCREETCSCKEQGRSKTNFSKDMAVGLQLGFSLKPDYDLFRRVIDYGNSKNWIVCEADDIQDVIGRCTMSPKIISRWSDLLKAGSLTDIGEDDAYIINTEFPAHLDIVSIMTSATLYGAISGLEKWTIEQQAQRVPENLLFQAAAARFAGTDPDKVARKLLESFPEDRLPNTTDYCTDYLYQRDRIRFDGDGKEFLNPDWLPCPDRQEEHLGTDFLFAAWVLLHNFGG
jgi:hypothetical protein